MKKKTRYGAPVMFVAGFTATIVLAAALHQGFHPETEVWLAAIVIASLILHGVAGAKIARTRAEIDMLRRLADRMSEDPGESAKKIAPALSLDRKDLSEEDRAMLARLRDAIDANRLELYLQPIVSLPQRKTRFYEAFSRLRDSRGETLVPGQYLATAERTNRIGLIDNLILLRCVQSLRKIDEADGAFAVFCNVSPATLYDTEFFHQFAEYLADNDDLAPRIVFELTWPALQLMHPRVEKNVAAVAAMGFAFSVDHVQTLAFDVAALRERNVRYVKADRKLLEAGGGPTHDVAAACARLAEAGIDIIAEKIESDADLEAVAHLPIDFAQGNLFGRPRRARSYLTVAAADPSSDAPGAQPETGGPGAKEELARAS
ncbi:MAG: EAL domain-containing protein [Pseudomonadota bacterium]